MRGSDWVRDAEATLTFARMDTHIPLNPASVEQSAPAINETVILTARVEALPKAE